MGLAAMLERLLPIHKVTDLTLRANAVERELAMFKVMGKGTAIATKDCGRLRPFASWRSAPRWKALCSSLPAPPATSTPSSISCVDRSRRSVAHQRRRDVARAKCDFRPRQPSFSFAIPISKNESPLSTIRL